MAAAAFSSLVSYQARSAADNICFMEIWHEMCAVICYCTLATEQCISRIYRVENRTATITALGCYVFFAHYCDYRIFRQ